MKQITLAELQEAAEKRWALAAGRIRAGKLAAPLLSWTKTADPRRAPEKRREILLTVIVFAAFRGSVSHYAYWYGVMPKTMANWFALVEKARQSDAAFSAAFDSAYKTLQDESAAARIPAPQQISHSEAPLIPSQGRPDEAGAGGGSSGEVPAAPPVEISPARRRARKVGAALHPGAER